MDKDMKIIKPETVGYTIDKFACIIGILPTSYKLAYTYEEQINCIGEYLEKIVYPAIKNNEEALQELQGLFLELKDYVDNYFDNLNVQEEVNKKLDEMAEDGELQRIIAEYLNITSILCFDTVSDMIASEDFSNGSYAKTYGFYSLNDGGSAYYKIRTITNQDVIDNSTKFAITNDNTLIAELIPLNGIVNVKQFGCKGDNETNDTTKFQIASDYAESNKMKFYVPEGNYILDTVTLNNIIDIEILGYIYMSNSTQFFNVYENARGGKIANIFIKTIKTGILKMMGLNSNMVTIQLADNLLLLANDENGHDFIAYNIFKLGFIHNLEIKDEGTGTNWINENLFLGGRFLSVKIHGNYSHQDNMFFKPQCEGTDIQILKGDRNKFIDARLEGNNINIVFGENTDGNIITCNYYETLAGALFPHRFFNQTVDDRSGNNTFIKNEYLEENIGFSLNKFTAPSSYTIENDKIKLTDNSNVYETDLINIENVEADFNIFFNTTEKNLVFKIEAFDENKDRITTNPNLLKNSPNLSWSSNGYYNQSFARNTYWAIIDHTKTDVVKYIKVKIYKPSNVVTSYIENVDLYLTNIGKINKIGYLLEGLKKNITI